MKQNLREKTLAGFVAVLLLFLVFCLLFLFVCTTIFFPRATDFSAASTPMTSRQPPACPTVVLDAGHGGYDSGTQAADGTLEKDLNLIITQKIAAFLHFFDVNVVLTRSDDTPPNGPKEGGRKRTEILARAKICHEENAALFLSVHMNSFPQSSCRGAQVFYNPKNAQNAVFATLLQDEIKTRISPENTRVPKESDLIFLLTQIACPAALLECGFLSNDVDLNQLKDEAHQSKLAFTVAVAIVVYLFTSQ